MSHTTAEKLDIVKKAYAPGTTKADKEKLAKDNGVSLATLYSWKSDFSNHSKSKLVTTNHTTANGKGKPKLNTREEFIVRVKAEKERLLARIEVLDALLVQYET